MARLKSTFVGEKRTVHFGFQLTSGEADDLHRLAAVYGISRADYSRSRIFGRTLPRTPPALACQQLDKLCTDGGASTKQAVQAAFLELIEA